MDQLLREEIKKFREDWSGLKGNVDKMYQALLGSDIAGDGGLVRRIIDLEVEVDQLRKQHEKFKEDNIKTEFYVKVMWTMVGVASAAAFGFLMQLIFKR